jgi:integrase
MELQADRRDLPPNPKILEQVTLGQLVQRYIDVVSPRKRTKDTEQTVLRAFLRHRICTKTLAQLGVSDFVAYRDERLILIKPSSLKRSLVPIRHLFEVARDEWGYPIKSNPLAKLKIAESDSRRERRLRSGELDRLLEAASSCRNKLMKPLILFALATGMRRGEMLGLRMQHLDLERRTIFIPQSKNGHSRTLPLMNEALVALQGHLPAKDHIFPVSPNAVRLSWEHLRARAGLDDLHFHDLRHEAISRLFELGLSIPEVVLISGHRD